MTPTAELTSVSKKFRKNLGSIKEMVGYLMKTSSPSDFWALKGINLTLRPGDSLGVIGTNGSGKSTLLRLIARITSPTTGSIITTGRVGGLIELGAGFHPELTGSENIFLYGSILGMSKKEILNRYSDIAAFSEITEWLGTPVKFYSSGMFARLGFAITIHAGLDILLVDEAIAVGDTAFQEKCLEKIEEYRKLNKIVIFVSHDHERIKRHMSRTVWIDHGQIVADGTPEAVIEKYNSKYTPLR